MVCVIARRRNDGGVLDDAVSSATGHFVAQRVTAIVLVLLGSWFAVSLNGLDSFEHAIVVAFIAEPLNGALLALMCASLAYHSHLGVQVVIDDYVHAAGLNKASLMFSRISHLVVVALSIYAVFEIGTSA